MRSTALVSLLLTAACSLGCRAGAQPEKGPSAGTRPPNLIVILLDDADVPITESMPRLRSLLIDKGIRFSSTVANTPLCGPSRAVLLSGQYAHNNKVYYNNGPEGGYTPWLAGGYDDASLGPWMKERGYRTGLFGKYINDFPMGRAETFVPSGWDDFRGILSDREAHNVHFTLNENGALKVYEASSGGYQTDVLSQRLDAFVRAKNAAKDQPFFALLALSAPHIPPEPAERHANAFPGETAPRKPSFDEADISDKPKMLRDQAQPLTKAEAQEIDRTYRGMRQSLLAVEDALEGLLKTLSETGELSRTYIFFTSDNGWFRGEHRIPAEKYAPYEESIRVPLFVRGPGVREGQTIERVVGIVDLAPTLMELAGASKSAIEARDGRSFAPLLAGDQDKVLWRSATLIEHFGGGAPYRVRSYTGFRSESDVYIEYVSGEKEYYDLTKDPYQMDNRAASLSPESAARMSASVAALKTCAAVACRSADAAIDARR